MDSTKRILFIFGTRPEAIKLCPVVRQVRCETGFQVQVCVTAQHRAMLDQVLHGFGIQPDYDLNLMTPGQTLAQMTGRILLELDKILEAGAFRMVVVQGDTTTTLAASLAAFYRRVPVAHVEAGLRTGDMAQPFPEEMNRVATSRLAALHFAPTERARKNLLAEGTPANDVFVTGNSGIDAVLYVARALERGDLHSATGLDRLDRSKKLILVTAHRRESFGDGIRHICDALATLAEREDVQIVYPVHRNPNVLGPVTERLGACPNVLLLEPLDYISFVDLMRHAWLLITDSGGIQEEAPSLGKPVLVMRECTERPEAVEAGTVKLVGTDPRKIVGETVRLIQDEAEYLRMSRIHNPYGDGRTSARIARILAKRLSSHLQ
ncbi:MAG TPA: UDP-N-acetylglucosamine 2-epimerase (non-hydrolyzing) [Bryobacteraceae bacterium]|nr:UDP-N-acetylglucosamine 2-epimerase (non-hydrolyzing) [Bryobacteraceae bacterium]